MTLTLKAWHILTNFKNIYSICVNQTEHHTLRDSVFLLSRISLNGFHLRDGRNEIFSCKVFLNRPYARDMNKYLRSGEAKCIVQPSVSSCLYKAHNYTNWHLGFSDTCLVFFVCYFNSKFFFSGIL